jgi:hypothetical protein
MKLNVTIATETHLDVQWPDGVPLPSAGDSVVMQSGSENLSFVVQSKFFSIGIDPRDGSPATQLTIQGSNR